jgi:hypothetical protein
MIEETLVFLSSPGAGALGCSRAGGKQAGSGRQNRALVGSSGNNVGTLWWARNSGSVGALVNSPNWTMVRPRHPDTSSMLQRSPTLNNGYNARNDPAVCGLLSDSFLRPTTLSTFSHLRSFRQLLVDK